MTNKKSVRKMSESMISDEICDLRDKFICNYIDDNPNDENVEYYHILENERTRRGC